MKIDLRNLPDAVRERLDLAYGEVSPGTGLRCGVDRDGPGGVTEARVFSVVREDRADGADGEPGAVDIVGHPVVYDRAYDVGGAYGWSETIAAGALTKSLAENDRVVFLANHDASTALGFPLAATYSGDLVLTDSPTSLRCDLTLDPASNVVAQMIADGVTKRRIDSMSWAFRVIRQEWNGDYTERIIREAQIFDVSAVTYPANPEATIAERSDTGGMKRLSVAAAVRDLELISLSRR